MRNLTRAKIALAIALTALGLATGNLLSVGCVTKTPQKQAVDSLFITAKGVNDAYAAYLDGILAGTIKTNNFPKIAAAYQDFQISFAMTLQVLPANASKQKLGDPMLLKQANAVLVSIDEAKKGLKR